MCEKIDEEIEIESFEEVSNILNEEEKANITLIESILAFDGEKFDEVCKSVENSKKDIYFVLKCIEYLITIRHKKMKNLFTLFMFFVKQFNKTFSPIYETLRELLILEGYISDKSKYESKEVIFDIFPKDSIEYAIKDDNVDIFIELSSKPEFNPNNTLSVNKIPYLEEISDHISYLQLMAYFGAEKCFKRALLSGLYPEKDLKKYAIMGGNYEIIQLLRPRSEDYFDNCLEISIKYHHYEISDWLLRNYKCENIFHFNCLCYFNFIAFYFFNRKKNYYLPTISNKEIFDQSFIRNLPNIKYLVEECGLFIDKTDDFQRTLLHFAAKNGSLDVVRYLVDNGANIMKNDDYNNTPLHEASENGQFGVVRFLVENGANVDQCDIDLCTPLHNAVCYGHLEVVKYLVRHGANIEHKDLSSDTPLHKASCFGFLDIVKYLIDSGAKIGEKNDDGTTELHWATENGFEDIVIYLLSIGADVNQKDELGRIPLHWAAENNYYTITEILIEHGSNIIEKDNEGNTPMQCAIKENNTNIVNYFKCIGI